MPEEQNSRTNRKPLEQSLLAAFEEHGMKIQDIQLQQSNESSTVWIIETDNFQGPSAHLYENGSAMYFNDSGKLIRRLQEEGHEGLEEFLTLYPEAELYICDRENMKKEKVENPHNYIRPETANKLSK